MTNQLSREETIAEELKRNDFFILATVDDRGRPVQRPFSSVTVFEGNLYICTNNTRTVYQQLMNHPEISILSVGQDGSWIRISARAFRDDRDIARQAMLDDPSGPGDSHSVGDHLLEVFRVEEISCTKYCYGREPEVI